MARTNLTHQELVERASSELAARYAKRASSEPTKSRCRVEGGAVLPTHTKKALSDPYRSVDMGNAKAAAQNIFA